MIATVKQQFNCLIQAVIRKDEDKGFKPIPKRWVEERTFAWFDNDRKLSRNYELLTQSAQEWLKLPL
ncbi:MAG: transposase [Chitinophagales bacterium]|nr:transposase [Chitinophagales bacterium]